MARVEQEPVSRRVTVRAPLAAALLSFVLPGLGQAFAGRRRRGAFVALPTIGVVAALLLVFAVDRKALFGLALDAAWLNGLLALDLLLLAYHAWAVVDAYRVAGGALPRLSFARTSRLTTPDLRPAPARSVAVLGVGAILASTIAVHGAVAASDASWQHTLYCLTAATPCWVTANTASAQETAGSASGAATPNPLGTLSTTAPALPTFDLGALPSMTTSGGTWSWDPNGQFNVLLAGIGVQDDPSQLGPDTIMVLHVDRATGRAALISVGRNNVCVPLPQGIAENFATSQIGCPPYSWSGLINDFPNEVLGNCRVVPLYADTCGQAGDLNRYLRAYKAFEEVIGGLLGLTIDGSVWVNPTGLTRLIDDVGGVDIDVPTTVFDMPCGPAGTWQSRFATCADPHNGYSVPTGVDGVAKMKADAAKSNGLQSITWSQGQDVAMTIKAGMQHMDGDWALAYARTREFTGGGDFDRAGRQQLVLKALRTELDPCTFASPANVASLLGTLSDIPYAFNTDLPITNVQDLSEWASLTKRVFAGDVRSIVLDPVSTGESYLTIGGIEYPAVDAGSWGRIKEIVAGSLAASTSANATPGATASVTSTDTTCR